LERTHLSSVLFLFPFHHYRSSAWVAGWLPGWLNRVWMDMMGKDINKQFDHYLLIIPRSVNKHIIHRRNDQSHQSIISNYYTQFIGPFPPYSKQTMAKKQKEVEVTLSKWVRCYMNVGCVYYYRGSVSFAWSCVNLIHISPCLALQERPKESRQTRRPNTLPWRTWKPRGNNQDKRPNRYHLAKGEGGCLPVGSGFLRTPSSLRSLKHLFCSITTLVFLDISQPSCWIFDSFPLE